MLAAMLATESEFWSTPGGITSPVCPGEEQQHGVIGVVGKAILRIGGGDQLAGLGVVAGGDEFRDALVLRGLEQGDLRHRHRCADGEEWHLQRGMPISSDFSSVDSAPDAT